MPAGDLEKVVETCVERILPAVGLHPGGHERASPAYDSHDPFLRQGKVVPQNAAMDGDVVHPLASLAVDHLQEPVRVQVLALASRLLHGLVDGDCSQRNGTLRQDGRPDLVQVPSRGEIHHRVRPELDGPPHLGDLFLDPRAEGGIPDVGVHLGPAGHPDPDGLHSAVGGVGGNHHPPRRHLFPDLFGGKALLARHLLHLGGDLPAGGALELGSRILLCHRTSSPRPPPDSRKNPGKGQKTSKSRAYFFLPPRKRKGGTLTPLSGGRASFPGPSGRRNVPKPPPPPGREETRKPGPPGCPPGPWD